MDKMQAITALYEDRMKDLLSEIATANEQINKIAKDCRHEGIGIVYLQSFTNGSLMNLNNIIEITLERGSELKEVMSQ